MITMGRVLWVETDGRSCTRLLNRQPTRIYRRLRIVRMTKSLNFRSEYTSKLPMLYFFNNVVFLQSEMAQNGNLTN